VTPPRQLFSSSLTLGPLPLLLFGDNPPVAMAATSMIPQQSIAERPSRVGRSRRNQGVGDFLRLSYLAACSCIA